MAVLLESKMPRCVTEWVLAVSCDLMKTPDIPKSIEDSFIYETFFFVTVS
jgi:hypothetical protein